MRQEMDDEMETRMAYRELIHENIGYEALCSMYGKERIDEVVTLMLDTVCTTHSKLLINGDAVSAEWVRSRLLKLDYFHIQYVLNCLDSNTTKVRNIRQYMLTALYNAISTMNHYYTAEVNHNMYGDGPAGSTFGHANLNDYRIAKGEVFFLRQSIEVHSSIRKYMERQHINIRSR